MAARASPVMAPRVATWTQTPAAGRGIGSCRNASGALPSDWRASSGACSSRSPISEQEDSSGEEDQVSHLAPLLGRIEPRHPDAGTITGLRRPDDLDRRGLSCTLHGLTVRAKWILVKVRFWRLYAYQFWWTPRRRRRRLVVNATPTACRWRRWPRPSASTSLQRRDPAGRSPVENLSAGGVRSPTDRQITILVVAYR
jgi:hypothetical protein